MAYEATLYDNKPHETWVGHIVTNQQLAGFTYSQIDELVFEATADEIVNQIIKDGVILKGD